MSRTTYVLREVGGELKLVDVTDAWRYESERPRGVIIGDDIRTEIDGQTFTSKRSRDEYLKATGLTSKGDYSAEWLRKRREGGTPEQKARATREQVGEAYRRIKERGRHG